jgi:acyl-[acyl-carrier-protein] desaturase
MDLSPDQTMAAVVDVLKNFQMPGHTIEGFGRKSVKIALAGIYDIRQHLDEVIWPVLRAWNVMERNDFGPQGEALREELAAFLSEMDEQAALFEAKRDERLARLAARL